jgi:hypothetical protein
MLAAMGVRALRQPLPIRRVNLWSTFPQGLMGSAAQQYMEPSYPNGAWLREHGVWYNLLQEVGEDSLRHAAASEYPIAALTEMWVVGV